ncbi:MAG TPA: hypothetical protein VLQ79_10925, partial [Myxococcaceae bacterium]|nr:hypothetical protein [Myxococcaceae bacterium]
HHGGDSIWLTTSRHAVKVGLIRKHPSSSFMVDGGSRCVLLEGEAEVYDPRSVPGIARALMAGPGFYLNLAGYALKNASFIGGYLRDLARIPGEWWPQNRALLRLRVARTWSLPSVSSPPAGPAQVPGVPAAVSRTLTRVPVAYVCTLGDGVPMMAPALWNADGTVSVVIRVAGFLGINRRAAGGLAIESHHAYRATRMVGAYLRGRFTADADAKTAMVERYGLDSEPAGMGLRFEAERATWWRGFSLETAAIEKPVAKLV